MGPHNACSYADLAMTTIDHKILDTTIGLMISYFHQIGQNLEMIVLVHGLGVYQLC